MKRVKIDSLPKAQNGKAVGNMVNYINQTFGWNNQEPQQSSLDYFYNMGKQKPQSGFDYNTYMNYANKYLGRDTFKGTTLTAKDLADAAQEFYNSTNYVYPIDLLLAQGQMETKLGKTLKSKNNYFNVGNTDEGATRDFKSGKDSALDYMNLMYNDYMNKGQKTPEQLLVPNGFVNYQGNRYASNPNYETDVANQRQFIKRYLGVKKEGGPLPEAQFGLGDKIFKKRVLNKYPTMQNIYGPKGENLNIIKDKNFKASDYGYGDIEFIFPGDGSVTYSDDYTYQSPTPDKYTAVYNPKGARRGDVFLDMLHGMRNDPGYEQLLQNFSNTVKDARGEDMKYFYEKDLLEGYAGDGQERWDDNYIDGLLRSELYKNAPGKVSAKKDYEIERTESSPQMQTAAKDIYDYLRTGPKNLSQEKQGGAVKRVKIKSLPKAQSGTEVKSGWDSLTEAQKELLRRGNNYDTVKAWYENDYVPARSWISDGRTIERPGYNAMDDFGEWINQYDAQAYLNQLDPNSEESKMFNEALKNNRDWYNQWYTKRKQLPQFKDVAEKRLAIKDGEMVSELRDPINLSIDWWKTHKGLPDKNGIPEVFYAPEIGAIARETKADYNINFRGTDETPPNLLQNLYYRDANGKLQNSLITHEESHMRDKLVPQAGTKHNVPTNEWGQNEFMDPIETIISKDDAAADPRNIGYSRIYQQAPTEVRARLNAWRMRNNIDALKDYTPDELKLIIDKDLQNPNLDENIKELYETIKNNPEYLKFLHDTYVSNDANQEPALLNTSYQDQVLVGKYGGSMKKVKIKGLPKNWKSK